MADGLVAYAVLPAGCWPPPDLHGPDGAPVEAVEEQGLALWVSPLHHAPSPCAAAARDHHAVVAAALGTGVTPVPLRFGQWLEGWDAARRVLSERGSEWRAALQRLAGTVEVGVRAQVASEPMAARSVHTRMAAGGTEYMRSLVEQHAGRRAAAASARALADALGQAGAAWIRQSRIELLAAPPGSLSAAYLVARSEAPLLQGALRQAAREHAVDSFAVTGPWPPYSFT